MGIQTTHNCWQGPATAFYLWRVKLAEAAGLPPLELMEGYYDDPSGLNPYRYVLEFIKPTGLPIKWEALRKDPLITLLKEDVERIELWEEQGLIDRLGEVSMELSREDREITWRFINGLKDAYDKSEAVEFF